jgi:YggT family protein
MSVAPLVNAFLFVFDTLIYLYICVMIVAVIASWMVSFGILNTYNPNARAILRVLAALTEPVFRPVRRLIPPLGGLDLSPLIVYLLLRVLQYLVDGYLPALIPTGG